MNSKIRLILPSRVQAEHYDTQTALGRSLSLCPRLITGVERRVFGGGNESLPKVFNIAIREAATDPAILVFMHDDIEMRDFFWPQHVRDGLEKFDMIGLAGNTRRTARQAAWGSIGENLWMVDREHLSGTVAHDSKYGLRVNYFGPSYQKCKFIDGLFMAVRSETLIANDIFFDERFNHHFYDLDLCRQFEVKDLSVGTWGISLVHHDNQSYHTEAWREGFTKYIDKWQY